MRSWRLVLIILAVTATAACHDSKTASKGEQPPSPPPAAQASASAPSPAAPPTELASLAWVPANHDANLQAFDLRLSGVDVLSVCHVPSGWTIDATGAGLGVTRVQGNAVVGAAFIGDDDLADLSNLLLVRARPGETPGVTGKLTTGAYGGDGGQVELKATPKLLRRAAAAQCPPPKP